MKGVVHFILFFFVILLNASVSFSQNETSKWYFGGTAGLDFMTNPPSLLTNGAMSCEDCASIANPQGTLQFYTDGLNVWNANHVLMANGTLTTGSPSGPVIIVKQPGNSNIYYIFTKPNYVGWPFMYSVVDMNLAAGMGSVTVKAIALCQSSARKVAAVKKCNSSYVWIISHDYNSALFRTFLLSSSGISPTGTLSGSMAYIGTNQADQEADMKLSPNGKKLAIATGGGNTFHIYDFDLANGVVTNPTTPLILGSFASTYRAESCEFSPDGSKFYGNFYAQDPEPIYQWDLCAGSDSAIIASKYLLPISQNTNMEFGQMQLAKDGKIYIARVGNPNPQTNLSVINNPNQQGLACNYSNSGLSIAPKLSSHGLPLFVSTYFRPKPSITHSDLCGTVFFLAANLNTPGCASATEPINSISWDFGEPSSPSNTSNLTNPSHNYSAVGNYAVKLIINYSCGSDTLIKLINIAKAAPVIGIIGTTTLCAGESTTLSATGAYSYTWSTGALSPSLVISPTASGIYSIVGADSSTTCRTSKQISVQVNYCLELKSNSFRNFLPEFYPNPTTGILQVTVTEDLEISVCNIYGIKLSHYTCRTGSHAIDLSSFSSGIYFLNYIQNGKSTCFKIIKSQ